VDVRSATVLKTSSAFLVLAILIVGGLVSTKAGPLQQVSTPQLSNLSGTMMGVMLVPCSRTKSGGTPGASTSATQPAALNPNRGYVGLEVDAVDDCGVQVVSVIAGGPADKAGLQAGDVIVAMDGTSISNLVTLEGLETPSASYSSSVIETFFGQIESRGAESSVILSVQRSGQQTDISVILSSAAPVTSSPAAPGTAAPTSAVTAAATSAATAAQ